MAFEIRNGAVVGTNTLDSSAFLQIDSTDKGFLLPRMTAAQRNAIATPAEGLQVYVTDTDPGLYYYDGSVWVWIDGAPDAVPDLQEVTDEGSTTTNAITLDGAGLVLKNGTGQVTLVPALGISSPVSVAFPEKDGTVMLNLWGPTSSRPSGATTGFTYFDTDLGYRIDFDGTNWVNATGAIV